MSDQLFRKLEEKINQVLELVELQGIQLEEVQEKNASLNAEVAAHRQRQQEWENSLAGILRKLDRTELRELKSTQKSFEQIVLEPELEGV